ncbi:hypothetical protein AMAG_17809 [Allomyces macrogynus ATCC 38327]|uniref:Uncharacterized protein n=1 Tax=Allomyces macrogynus (strain ATCC 38327) TaxID=578462 RepID=A0A0L0RZX4_ALLM3|nr:hypothetical protein AMAG_17809 [Allomyces macrogynus ATCC 38327]|eukprot:KNE55700.1 hypothetical protein AMAG_17809 [Allomyces macrogynus ATCC 38327]
MVHPPPSMISATTLGIPTPRLECMPDVVIDRIAELLLSRTTQERHADKLVTQCSLHYEVGQLALMHLALAAPSLFAPCLRAVIRNATRFRTEPIRCWTSATVPLMPKQIGHCVWAILRESEETNGRAWSLVLPLRARDRSCVGPSVKETLQVKMQERPTGAPMTSIGVADLTVDADAHWSLLPVRFDQLQYYELCQLANVVPTRCRELVVLRSFDSTIFPASLAKLRLEQGVLPSNPVVIQRALQEVPKLRSLELVDVSLPEEKGAALATLAAHIPTSVTALKVVGGPTVFTDAFVSTLAGRIQASLAGIKLLDLQGCSPARLAPMVAALPRVGMRELRVLVEIKGEQDMVACTTSLAQAWPTSVDCLHLTLTNSMWPQQVVSAIERIPTLVARLPLAAQSLHVLLAFLSLDVSMFRQIPLAPTLTQLTLHGSRNNVNMVGLERLMTRLPSSLVDLSLISWSFGGTTTAAGIGWSLPQQLEALRLFSCELTDADLAEFELPASLRYLDLESNKLSAVLVKLWPVHLQTLVLKGTAVTDMQLEWIASLPTSLRVLNVDHTAVRDQFANALLQRMPAPRKTSRMTLHIAETKVSESAKIQLSAKFNVFDVKS